jgi:phospholipid transport system substrate-binding protein
MQMTLRLPKSSWLALSLTDVVKLITSRPAPVAAPSDVVRRAVEQLMSVQARTQEGERRGAEIDRVLERLFDFSEVTRRCLGLHAESRSPAERQEFARLIGGLFGRLYVARLKPASKLAWAGNATGGRASVRVTVTGRDGSQLRLDHRLHRTGTTWMVHDLLIDGVSLVEGYRDTLDRAIRTTSYEEMVWSLRFRAAGAGSQSGAA